MRGGPWWLVLLSVGWLGMAVGAEPDPEEVRRLMEKYERKAAKEAAKKAPAPKPRPKPEPVPKPQPKPRPKPAPAPVESVRGDGPKMVRIQGGCFQTGSPVSETEREPVEPNEWQHRVCVADFAIGRTEVTVGEFKRFVAATGYLTDAERDVGGEGCFINYREGNEWKFGYRAGYSWRNPGFPQGDNHPVVCVSWNDALAYGQWLTQETRQRYRLPTEAEWEYAARAGTTTARYWGDDSSRACQYANIHDQSSKRVNGFSWEAHDCDDGWAHTALVGSFKANAWGLKDMLGNVYEWTCSVYDKNSGGAERECANNDTTSARAVRGGSWTDFPTSVRSAYRLKPMPAFRSYYTGFRIARSL